MKPNLILNHISTKKIIAVLLVIIIILLIIIIKSIRYDLYGVGIYNPSTETTIYPAVDRLTGKSIYCAITFESIFCSSMDKIVRKSR